MEELVRFQDQLEDPLRQRISLDLEKLLNFNLASFESARITNIAHHNQL